MKSWKLGAWLALALCAGGTASCGRAAGDGKESALDGCVRDDDCFGADTCLDGQCEAATGGAGVGGTGSDGEYPEPGAGGIGGVTGNGAGGATEPAELCEPGGRVCDGPNVKRCSGDGKQWTIDDTCSLTQACSNGACRDIECVPHRELCRDNQVWECGDDGTTAELVKRCQGDQYCVEDEGDASCSATVCVQNQPICDEGVATQCKPDGSGAAAGGQDCAANGEVCYGGECRDLACTLGEKLCQHGDVYLCAEGGSDVALFRDCAEDEACDAVLGACVPRICTPGAKTCDATRVQTCNAAGTGWETAKECALDNALCVEGSCRAKVCVPNTELCNDDAAYTCDALGIEYRLKDYCGAGRYCAQYGYWAYCENSYCVPGETLCSANALQVCNEEGNTYASPATPCGAGNVCAADFKSCTAQLCQPDTTFCAGRTISRCWHDGLTTYAYETCPDTTYCATADNYTRCLPYDCVPNSTACLANKVGTCQADGLALASITTDCAETGDVCNAAVGCVPSTMDQLGTAESLETYELGRVIGNSFDVQSSRKLTQLDAQLTLAGEHDLLWLVFERPANSGDYEKKLEKTVAQQSGSGYFSSGPLNVTLQAGKRYVLAVMTPDASVVAYFDAPTSSPNPSFGRFVAGVAAPSGSSYFDGYSSATRRYAFRATTTAP